MVWPIYAVIKMCASFWWESFDCACKYSDVLLQSMNEKKNKNLNKLFSVQRTRTYIYVYEFHDLSLSFYPLMPKHVCLMMGHLWHRFCENCTSSMFSNLFLLFFFLSFQRILVKNRKWNYLFWMLWPIRERSVYSMRSAAIFVCWY